jgi:hypothetical protein
MQETMCEPFEKLESSLNRITPHRLHQYDNAQNTKKILPISIYTIDQGSPCPLATLNPFGRELLLLDVSTGIK